MHHYTIDITDEVYDRLAEISNKYGISKGEALRRGFSLLSLAEKEQLKGNALAIVEEQEGGRLNPIARLVGIL